MSVLDNYSCEGQISMFEVLNQDISYGKTSQERSVRTKARTSDVYLKKFAELRIKPPMYLCLKRVSGLQADVSWETVGALRGEYTMHSFGESPSSITLDEWSKWERPNAVVESRLSQILEVSPSEKYYLSAKACQGILNRALKRGKKLPEQLEIALRRQAMSSEMKSCQPLSQEQQVQLETPKTDLTSSVSKNVQDAQGGGKGILIQDDKTASIRTQNNQSVCYGFEPGAAKRLNPDERFNEEKSPTLRANMGDNQVGVLCYGMDNERRRGPEEHEDESPTITAKCGTGGNNVPVVINVETEVSVRKYEVDKEKLKECLQSHKFMTMQEIADKLGKPKTLVEHWFRNDESFAIPDPEIWIDLKSLLGIETNEFDESIMTFETKPGNYDMRNRIHVGNVSPTLKAGSGNDIHLVEEPVLLATNQNDAEISQTGICNTLPAAMGMGGGYVPMVTETYQETTGALCASGYDKLGTQEAMNDMYVVSSYGVDSYNQMASEEVAETLKTNGGGDNTPKVCYGVTTKGNGDAFINPNTHTSLSTGGGEPGQGYPCVLEISTDSDHVPCVTYGLDRASFNQGQNAKFNFSVEEELAPTLVNRGPGGVLTKQ